MYIIVYVYARGQKLFVAFAVILFIQSVNALCAVGDVGEGYAVVRFKLVKPIAAVNLPEFEYADLDCVLRATEGARHAQNAVVSEAVFAVLACDVVLRAATDAFVAMYAFFCIYLECNAVHMREMLFYPADRRNPHSF